MIVNRQRKSNRLKNFNYSSTGYYFVTICIKNGKCLFGNIIKEKMILNKYGKIVKNYWLEIPKHYKQVILDKFIVMPNHVHGIIIIHNNISSNVGTIHELSLRNNIISNRKLRRKMLLSKIIGFFKMKSSKSIHQIYLNKFKWQRSYYDHIIRNEKSLLAIRRYIHDNPKHWNTDTENPNK